MKLIGDTHASKGTRATRAWHVGVVRAYFILFYKRLPAFYGGFVINSSAVSPMWLAYYNLKSVSQPSEIYTGKSESTVRKSGISQYLNNSYLK